MKRSIYIVFLLVFALTSCSESEEMNRVLTAADSLLTVQPDSALRYLEAHARLKGEGSRSQRMRYELLRATAQNRSNFVFTSDSTAQILVEYYDKHGTANERMQAHYLLGRAYHDMQEVPEALKCYQDAVEQADTMQEDCDYYTLSAVYGQMAEIFHQQYLPHDELWALRQLQKCSSKIKDTLSVIQAYNLKARPYYLMNETDSVKKIAIESYRLYSKYGYRQLGTRTIVPLIDILLDEKQYEDAYSYMMQYERESGMLHTGQLPKGSMYHYEKGRYTLEKNETDSALFHFRNLMGYYNEAAYKGLLAVYQKKGVADSIAKYAALYVAANDSARRSTSSEIVHRMSAMYNYSRHQRLAEQREQELADVRRNVAIGIAVLLLALCLILYINKRYQTKKRMEINALTRNLIAAEKELEKARRAQSVEKDIEALESLLAALSREKAQIKKEDLEKAFYEIPIYKTFHHLSVYRLNQIPPTESDWEEMTQQFVHYFPTYSSFINHQNILSPDQIHYAMLVRLSFSDQEIGIIMNKDRKRINNIKALINEKFWSEKSAKTLRERLNGQF